MKATIGIDSGHGGDSYGTYTVKTVKNKLFEKDYTLELALLLEEKLIENGFKTLLTRRNDVNPVHRSLVRRHRYPRRIHRYSVFQPWRSHYPGI